MVAHRRRWGCCFGHHCCRRATDYIKIREVDRNILLSTIFYDFLRQLFVHNLTPEYNVSNATIGRHTRPEASTSGFLDSPGSPLRRAMRLVMYRRTDRASKTADNYGTFLPFFMSFEPAVRPGQYGLNTCPMAASSGFA
jgi:hypothetical protein